MTRIHYPTNLGEEPKAPSILYVAEAKGGEVGLTVTAETSMATADFASMEHRGAVKPRSDSLALLYQGLITSIVRLQAGRQRLNDAGTFRRRIKEALQDIQKDAAAAGYSSRDIRDAEFAVVAFLDEAVLSLKDAGRDQWANYPLSVELYGDSIAGEVFYDRLDDLKGQTDSPRLADMLEVYLLCLLLGFEGKYSGQMKVQTHVIADRLRPRIEGIRGTTYQLSPPLALLNGGPVQAVAGPDKNGWKLWVLALIGSPLLLFVLYKLYLNFLVGNLLSFVPRVK